MQKANYKIYKNKILKIRLFITVIFNFFAASLFAQNRIQDNNSIAWGGIFTTTKFNDKWSWHAEFQCRRVDGIKTPQQNLFRTGINYQPDSKLMFRVGYARVQTFPYGVYPLNAMGKTFTENRFFEMVTINDNIKNLSINHRFILEQRFVGRYSSPELVKQDQTVYSNRIRYMFRIDCPLKKTNPTNNAPYIAAFNEVFIGFGKNVGENVFDQNRLGILFGYKFNSLIKIEMGYLNQIVQLGREVDNKNVFQYNQGLQLNTFLNFSTAK